MAKSRFEYVKQFERENYLLPDTYIVIRVDGKGFHKFSEHYKFEKPNDLRALQVMNRAARTLVDAYSDIIMAYGDSDEYLFLLRKQCVLFERREMKLTTTFALLMSTSYYYYWNQEFPDKPIELVRMPNFDARAVVYPNYKTVRDYFSWRQVDCHINNLYNTTFWTLVKGGMTPKEAENRLIGTLSGDKNEILYSQFGINYNNEPQVFKKGTIIVREYEDKKVETKDKVHKTDEKAEEKKPEIVELELSSRQKQRLAKIRKKAVILEQHVDIINDEWWTARPWIAE